MYAVKKNLKEEIIKDLDLKLKGKNSKRGIQKVFFIDHLNIFHIFNKFYDAHKFIC